MAEIAAMKQTIEELQSDAHVRITSEVGRLSTTNMTLTCRADENKQMYQEGSGFSLQSIMGTLLKDAFYQIRIIPPRGRMQVKEGK